uniref:Uncharacterized protein n=1 Tax=Rhizophagus irregularis (strain DAOM 181602 / DAOM 197198 / MUCL 43194) TaxID=747089 RepID=U9T4D4_RHIID
MKEGNLFGDSSLIRTVKTSHFTSLKTKAKSKVPSTYKYGTQLSGSSSNKNTK